MGYIDANLRPAQTVPGPRPASRQCSVTRATLLLTLHSKSRHQRRGSRVDYRLIVNDTTYSHDGEEDFIKPKLRSSPHMNHLVFSETLHTPKKWLLTLICLPERSLVDRVVYQRLLVKPGRCKNRHAKSPLGQRTGKILNVGGSGGDPHSVSFSSEQLQRILQPLGDPCPPRDVRDENTTNIRLSIVAMKAHAVSAQGTRVVEFFCHQIRKAIA